MMPDAVIVATARSPIGRAFKGSLKDMRPDDLAVQMVQAALAKVPELDPTEIDDLVLGAASRAASPISTWRGSWPCSPAWTICPARR